VNVKGADETVQGRVSLERAGRLYGILEKRRKTFCSQLATDLLHPAFLGG